MYQVDSFAEKIFFGNPAAVCPLNDWLSDDVLQSIAAENNLSETAFFVRRDGHFEIRWFTPTVEVDLCGHATLASAFVIFRFLEPYQDELKFISSRSGELRVRRRADWIELDFPRHESNQCEAPEGLEAALGFKPDECFLSESGVYVAVCRDEAQVRFAKPDFARLGALEKCVVITARGNEADFVSRYFAPSYGIPEDPVTGSSFCFLAPLWEKKLRKSELRAFQVSRREGEVRCVNSKNRVFISGQAALYLCGEITLN